MKRVVILISLLMLTISGLLFVQITIEERHRGVVGLYVFQDALTKQELTLRLDGTSHHKVIFSDGRVREVDGKWRVISGHIDITRFIMSASCPGLVGGNRDQVTEIAPEITGWTRRQLFWCPDEASNFVIQR